MTDPTGTIHEEIDGRTVEFRLTARVIGTLQAKYGNSIAGLLDGTAGDIPNFGALLDLVSLSLQAATDVDPEEAEGIADAALMRDTEIVGRIVGAAFPDIAPGNAKKPTKAA